MTAGPVTPSLFDVEPGPAPGPTPAPEPERLAPAPIAAEPEPEPADDEHQDDEPGRRYRCPTCAGTVAVPYRSRSITLADVRRTHEAACPGRHHRTTTKTGEPNP